MRLYFFLLLLLTSPIHGAESVTVTLDSGDEIPVQRFPGGKDRLLWLPSEYGLEDRSHPQLASGLADSGFDVWLADLHSAWFLVPGRSSYTDMDPADVAALIDRAHPDDGRLYVLASGRGAALALMALRQWRQSHPEAPALGGAVLLNPNLTAESPEPGKPPRYLPVSAATNLPVYVIQPMNSAKRWHLDELMERLRHGGSTVYAQLLPQTSDGFHVRRDATEKETAARRELPRLVRRAVTALNRHNGTRRAAAPEPPEDTAWRLDTLDTGLQPFPGDPPAPASNFKNMNGDPVPLKRYRGKVVLLNFWATWCPPCVEEIPSLGRLQDRLGRESFVVLGVDVGEPPATVRRFLDEVPADYPVLLDPEGQAVGPWAIRAFPTTFLLDRKGRIRYSYFGALQWDDKEVVRIIESLL